MILQWAFPSLLATGATIGAQAFGAVLILTVDFCVRIRDLFLFRAKDHQRPVRGPVCERLRDYEFLPALSCSVRIFAVPPEIARPNLRTASFRRVLPRLFLRFCRIYDLFDTSRPETMHRHHLWSAAAAHSYSSDRDSAPPLITTLKAQTLECLPGCGRRLLL